MDLNYTVYAHITPNGKYYIGITKQKVQRRWRKGKGYPTNEYFTNAIIKYGWDNIEHHIVASGITRQEALNFEIILIEQLKSNDREFGYNLTNGGDGVTGSKCPDWLKIKKSKAMSGKGNHMYGISLHGLHGSDNPMYGKPASNRRKIQCITTGKIFDSVTEGSKYYKTYNSDINKCCRGLRSNAGILNGQPLHWRYLD